MESRPGQLLSHYQLVEKIGEGGMGVVWKAQDTVLNRTVAIKVLPENYALDHERRQMLLEEAKRAGSVSHAHIAQIHEFGHEGDLDFIVMEYVEGQPLSKLLHGRPLPPHKVADFGQQIAAALSHAHRKKLLHRDIKPGNILVTAEGQVKVVDFGLATLSKSERTQLGSTVLSPLAGDAAPDELRGNIAGTLPYMSPEQVQGQKLDSRSDIFSLGSVLYEMTTGHQPFVGATAAEVAQEILRSRPPAVRELAPNVPIELNRIIDKALAARRGDRYQSTADLAVDLKRLGRELESGSAPSYGSLAVPIPTVRKRRWLWGAAGVLAAAVIAIVVLQLRPRQDDVSAPEQGARMQVAPTYRQITFTGSVGLSEISPDGQSIAFSDDTEEGGEQVVIQDLTGGDPLVIIEGQGFRRIRWSPEGTELLVRGTARGSPDLVPRFGGAPRPINAVWFWFAWSPDGQRITSAGATSKSIGIREISTGTTSWVARTDSSTWLRDIAWSPTGKFLALLTSGGGEDYTLWTIPPEGGTQRKVVEEKQVIIRPEWSADGAAIYYLMRKQDTSELFKVKIDPATGSAASDPTTVLTGLETYDFSVSRERNRLVYSKATGHSNLHLVTLHRAGTAARTETRQLTSGTAIDYGSSVSPDGGRVAFVRRGNIWTMPLEGGAARQLTYMESHTRSPSWSPDGSQIAFGSNEGGSSRVWIVSAEGGTAYQFTKTNLSASLYVTWAPGSRIIYQRPGNRNFHLLDPDTNEETILIKDDSVGWAFNAKTSPDGTRVAVLWNREQPEGDRGQNSWLISLVDFSEIRLTLESFTVVGWSSDAEWVYGWDSASSPERAVRTPAGGGEAETIFEWPFEDQDGYCVPGPDASSWICSVGESSSDVWLVENFDPDY